MIRLDDHDIKLDCSDYRLSLIILLLLEDKRGEEGNQIRTLVNEGNFDLSVHSIPPLESI